MTQKSNLHNNDNDFWINLRNGFLDLKSRQRFFIFTFPTSIISLFYTHTQTHTHTHTHRHTHTHTLLSLLDPEKSLKVFWDFFAKCQKYVICKSSNFTIPLYLFPSIRLFLPPFLMMILLLNILEKIHFRLIPFFRFPDDTKNVDFELFAGVEKFTFSKFE